MLEMLARSTAECKGEIKKVVGALTPDQRPPRHVDGIVDKQPIGRRLAELRRAAGLRQEDVAAAVGISRSHLAGMEKRHDNPGRATVTALASFYGVSVDFLINGEGAAPPPPQARQFIEDPDELALIAFWRSLSLDQRGFMLNMLRGASGGRNGADEAA